MSFSVDPWAKWTQKWSILTKPENTVFKKTRKTPKFPFSDTEESYLYFKVQHISVFSVFLVFLTDLSLFGPRVGRFWRIINRFVDHPRATPFEDYSSREKLSVNHCCTSVSDGSENARHFRNRSQTSQRWRHEQFLSVRCQENDEKWCFSCFSWKFKKIHKKAVILRVLRRLKPGFVVVLT